ncbi:tellurium resistance protein TerC [Corynebacterium sp.]|uniref:tellurium resistance protein TerC n=1 Tax=Corynebacterium sp. TaxID=1720 RepID=UPI0026DBB48C|nr:tellurium resistance protein TerC [Corynebacterium sp.]MDO5033110.1 tellurium resistance protein TerC [Corynebacterium sp.]
MTSPASGTDSQPTPLRFAYWVFVVGSVVMLTSGMVGIFGTDAYAPHLSAQQQDFLHRNTLFASVSNIVGALVISSCAAQLAGGGKWSRRVITVVSAYIMFVNIAAMAIGVGGLFLLAIPMVLMVGIFLMFRPACNEYVRERNPRY